MELFDDTLNILSFQLTSQYAREISRYTNAYEHTIPFKACFAPKHFLVGTLSRWTTRGVSFYKYVFFFHERLIGFYSTQSYTIIEEKAHNFF